jgi:hypothetical protein
MHHWWSNVVSIYLSPFETTSHHLLACSGMFHPILEYFITCCVVLYVSFLTESCTWYICVCVCVRARFFFLFFFFFSPSFTHTDTCHSRSHRGHFWTSLGVHRCHQNAVFRYWRKIGTRSLVTWHADGRKLSNQIGHDVKSGCWYHHPNFCVHFPKRRIYCTPHAKELSRNLNCTLIILVIQKLLPEDKEMCVQVCAWFQQLMLQHSRILDLTMCTDETWFHLGEYLNSQNKCLWALDSPHESMKKHRILQRLPFPIPELLGLFHLTALWTQSFTPQLWKNL